MEAVGLKRSQVDSTVFMEEGSGTLLTFHVDDIMTLGEEKKVERLFGELTKRMKLREVGRLAKEGDVGSFSNRRIRRTRHGFAVRGNDQLVEQLLTAARVQTFRHVSTPTAKYSRSQIETAPVLLPEAVRPYRSQVGALIHVAHDRPDIQYATKECGRGMLAPTTVDE